MHSDELKKILVEGKSMLSGIRALVEAADKTRWLPENASPELVRRGCDCCWKTKYTVLDGGKSQKAFETAVLARMAMRKAVIEVLAEEHGLTAKDKKVLIRHV